MFFTSFLIIKKQVVISTKMAIKTKEVENLKYGTSNVNKVNKPITIYKVLHFKCTIFQEYIILERAPTKKDNTLEIHAPHNPNTGIRNKLHNIALPADQMLE